MKTYIQKQIRVVYDPETKTRYYGNTVDCVIYLMTHFGSMWLHNAQILGEE
jgi:hypothetical protein